MQRGNTCTFEFYTAPAGNTTGSAATMIMQVGPPNSLESLRELLANGKPGFQAATLDFINRVVQFRFAKNPLDYEFAAELSVANFAAY